MPYTAWAHDYEHQIQVAVLNDEPTVDQIVYFVPLATEKVVLALESLFRPANGVRSTRSLVKIHNKYFNSLER